MNWLKLHEILDGMVNSDDDTAKTMLEAQVIVMFPEGTAPVHLSQSLVDGELTLLPMELASK